MRLTSRLWGILALVGAVAVALLVWQGRSSPPRRTDLVLISVDTLRPDHLGAYGYQSARTPHIDALAARGLRFTQAVTPLPRTTPAVASMLTGLWPIHHGSREVGEPMKELPTLASEFGANGYATIGVACNANLGRRQRIHLGFDAFVAGAMSAGEATDEALRLLEGNDPTRPLFLWVHYLDPHMPYRPPREWRPPSKAPECGRMLRIAKERGFSKGQLNEDRDGLASDALASCVDLYDGEISYTDHQIGRLLTTLEEARTGDGLLVVFTSDHGENLGEAGLFYEHGPNVHDASLRVPLIMAGPSIRVGIDDAVFRLEDLMPTLLSLLGLPGGDVLSFDGVDLSSRLGPWAWLGLREEPIALAESGSALQVKFSKSLVTGRRRGFNCLHHGAYSLCQRPGEVLQLFNHDEDPGFTVDLREAEPDVFRKLLESRRIWPPESARERTARTARFKLVEYPLFEGGYRSALYDLASDPDEMCDVRDEHPEVAERLQRVLDAWTAEHPREKPRERSHQDLENLRALGYIE